MPTILCDLNVAYGTSSYSSSRLHKHAFSTKRRRGQRGSSIYQGSFRGTCQSNESIRYNVDPCSINSSNNDNNNNNNVSNSDNSITDGVFNETCSTHANGLNYSGHGGRMFNYEDNVMYCNVPLGNRARTPRGKGRGHGAIVLSLNQTYTNRKTRPISLQKNREYAHKLNVDIDTPENVYENACDPVTNNNNDQNQYETDSVLS